MGYNSPLLLGYRYYYILPQLFKKRHTQCVRKWLRQEGIFEPLLSAGINPEGTTAQHLFRLEVLYFKAGFT